MPIPIPIILGAAGLGAYFLLRKKPADAALTAQTRAALAAPSSAPAAVFAPAPAAVFAPAPAAASSPAQDAQDALIVEEAIAQFSTERGASFDADPLVEQSMDRFPASPGGFASSAQDFSAPVQDNFLDPGTGLRAQNAPPPEEQVEEESTLSSVLSSFNPFGDDGDEDPAADDGFF